MLAAKTNNPEAINLLLQRGADPDIVDKNNFTALTHAIGTKSLEIVKTLIKKTTQQLNISLEKLAESELEIDDDRARAHADGAGRRVRKVAELGELEVAGKVGQTTGRIALDLLDGYRVHLLPAHEG